MRHDLAAIEERLYEIELGGRFERGLARRIANERTRRVVLRLRRMERFARQVCVTLMIFVFGLLCLVVRSL